MGVILAELEPVSFDPGQLVAREGDPPGPLYLVEEGYLRVFQQQDGRPHFLLRLGPGDFFGEMSLLKGAPRAASVEAVSPCRLLALSEETYGRLLSDVPGFKAQMEARIARYDYKRIARVPGDFADEILPAHSNAPRQVGPDHVDEDLASDAREREGRGSDGFPSSARSTRWTAEQPAWRWSAGISAARSAWRVSDSSSALASTVPACVDSATRRRKSGWPRDRSRCRHAI